ncbi:hypothetical protein MLD38_025287 [Melastoma candidum]|uniref:Uncharacterized protein n=1 Tax=Melastoma candidum TaxID=119954 RepID=A0ACB9NVV5_9MYRT|nr:hypothetical protein MLD38_025287 [Melastoma candidum]
MDLLKVIVVVLVAGVPQAISVASETEHHYVVYMGSHSLLDMESVVRANHEMVASVKDSSIEEARDAVLHHYSRSFRGFSAMLTQEQAQRLSGMESVVSVFESKMNRVHTTHSWDFLRLNTLNPSKQQLKQNNISDVIIGVIDSGFWPESESFSDEGLGPVPEKFKGECVAGEKFTSANCNRKVIGARFYHKGFEALAGPLNSQNQTFFLSARDQDGHGSHTASTISGNEVPNTNLYGLARGTARGGAPGARLAIYKACWFDSCADADLLAAYDDAISDGVDVLSLSLGPVPPQPSYFSDANSIGSFSAFRKGIVASLSAGNSFFPGTVTNAAPWILTVAASTIDREFDTNIYLGNFKIIKGYSLNPLEMDDSYGLILGETVAAPGVPAFNASFCYDNSLNPASVKGKIVVCKLNSLLESRREKAMTVNNAGGVGMILIDAVGVDVSLQFMIPVTVIDPVVEIELRAYMEMTKYPVARIVQTVAVLKSERAPMMAGFSSKGPNTQTPDIIKPDITAPGVNILAAWSPVSTLNTAGRPLDYNIISGTSMSCPHVSAVAAILKSVHPTWSPAAIKSAIMTTATVMDNTARHIGTHPNGTQATPFDYGSGHINPLAALDPGLLYDFNVTDVIDFLCGTGAVPKQLRNLTGSLISCPTHVAPPTNFNYPSMGVSNLTGTLTVSRTVTYCGQGPTMYKAYITKPPGVSVSVYPPQLRFNKAGEKMGFRVVLRAREKSNGFVFGSLVWGNGIHRVRSPIAVQVVST